MTSFSARLTSIGLVVVASLIPHQGRGIEALFWLEGEWQRETRGGTAIERWFRAGAGLAGEGVRLRDGDEVQTESLLLVEMGDGVFFIARPPENPYPVAFALVSADNGEFVFENTSHDFPQRITYSRSSDDAMTATIEGPGETGEPERIEFHFVRRR